MDSTDSVDGTTRGQKQDFRVMLRRYRLAAERTHEQLAESAGVSVRSISNLERGSWHTPRGDAICTIAAALDLSVEEARAFMAAARVREDGESLASPAYVPELSLVCLPHTPSTPTTSLLDAAREVMVLYEFLRHVGG